MYRNINRGIDQLYLYQIDDNNTEMAVNLPHETASLYSGFYSRLYTSSAVSGTRYEKECKGYHALASQ